MTGEDVGEDVGGPSVRGVERVLRSTNSLQRTAERRAVARTELGERGTVSAG